MASQAQADSASYYSSSSSETLDKAPEQQETKILNGKRFHLHPCGLGWRDLEIVPEGQDAATLSLKISQFTPGKPDLVLHAGSAKDGPVKGQVFLSWARSIKLGIGTDENDMVWIELKREGVLKKTYQFEFGERKYRMVRTKYKDRDVEGLGRLSMGHFQIIDCADESVVAGFVTESIGREKGTLTVKQGVGEAREMVFVLALLAWREKWRRKKRAGEQRLF